MNEQQSILLSMYKDIKEVLDRHGIRYYGIFGTALGAIRHNGIIPWDDDIDLAIFEEDLPAIGKYLREELDTSKYYYHEPTADTHPHLVFRDPDFENSLKNKTVPFIDFFVIERYPTTAIRRFFAWAFVWTDLVWVSILNHISSLGLHKILCKIPQAFGRFARRVVNKDSQRTTIFCTTFKRYFFDRDLYGEPRIHQFEDTEIPLPAKVEEFLEHEYGDYMTPPPEDKRHGATGFPCSIYKDYIWDMKKKQ